MPELPQTGTAVKPTAIRPSVTRAKPPVPERLPREPIETARPSMATPPSETAPARSAVPGVVAEPAPPAASEASPQAEDQGSASGQTSADSIARLPTTRDSGSTGEGDAADGSRGRDELRTPTGAAVRDQSEGIESGRIARAARPQGGYQIRPGYPTAARREGAQGTTVLRVRIRADGTVGEIAVQRSAGHPALDQAAADAVRRWKFEPARSETGEIVAMWVLIPIEFRLDRADGS